MHNSIRLYTAFCRTKHYFKRSEKRIVGQSVIALNLLQRIFFLIHRVLIQRVQTWEKATKFLPVNC